jgi:hypothetical protein
MDEVEFQELLNGIKSKPHEAKLEDLDTDVIQRLYKELNPYNHNIVSADNKKVRQITFSNTLLQETYQRRFTMTSLVGFLYRVLSEYDVPNTDRRWENKRKKVAAVKPWTPEQMLEQVTALRELAVLVSSAEKAVSDARTSAMKLDQTVLEHKLLDDISKEELLAKQKEVLALMKTTDELDCRYHGLQWAYMSKVRQYGKDMDRRFDDFSKKASQFPELRKDISKEMVEPMAMLEMPATNAKAIIKNFLNNWFEFNPDAHVRKSYDEFKNKDIKETPLDGLGTFKVDTADPDRIPVEVLLAKRPEFATSEDEKYFNSFTNTSRAYNSIMYLLRNETAYNSMTQIIKSDRAEIFRRYLTPLTEPTTRGVLEHIPPQDTFHRWEFYNDVNYEELRLATEAIYPEKSLLEMALIVYDYNEGTESEVKASYDEYCNTHQNNVVSDIKSMTLGNWTYLASFKKNREKINYYNQKTEILKRIMDRNAQDKILGQDLMKKRVHNLKAKNIQEAGPNDPGLDNYISSNGPADTQRLVTNEEMLRLKKTNGDLKAARELRDLDNAKAELTILLNKKKHGKLTDDEERELSDARRRYETAKEMIEVPENAIQVDVFETDAATGTFTKSKFYTEAEAPSQGEPKQGAAANVASR